MRLRVTRKLVLPVKAHCDAATIDHNTICIGIHRSGPSFLDTSWDGSSANRNEMRKMLFP